MGHPRGGGPPQRRPAPALRPGASRLLARDPGLGGCRRSRGAHRPRGRGHGLAASGGASASPPASGACSSACGIAAGLACAYNTPLGAALFAMEIILGSVSLEAFAPLAVSSATATLLTLGGLRPRPGLPRARGHPLVGPGRSGSTPRSGVLGGVVAALFLFALRASAALYARSGLPRPVAMATAGLALGLVTLRYPEIVGNGREAIAALFDRPWGGHRARAGAARAAPRRDPPRGGIGNGGRCLHADALPRGDARGTPSAPLSGPSSPASGPTRRPSPSPAWGALLAGTTHAPLTAVVMVFEMTLDYGIVVPLLLGSAVASLVATRLSASSVYTEALQRKAGEADVARRARRPARRRPRPAGPGDGRARPLAAAPPRRLRGLAPQPPLRGRRGADASLGAVNLHDVNEALRGPGSQARSPRGTSRARASRSRSRRRACPACSTASRRRSASGCPSSPTSSRDAWSGRSRSGTSSPCTRWSSCSGARDAGRPGPIEPPIETLVDEVPLPAGLDGRTFAESRFRERSRPRPAAGAARRRGPADARRGAALRGGRPSRGLRPPTGWPRCGGRVRRASLVAERLHGVEEGGPAGGQVAGHEAGQHRGGEAR